MDLINRQDAINVMCNKVCGVDYCGCATDCDEIKGIMELPSAERTVAHIGDFTQYQIDWLTEHDDLELEPELESWVIRFLKDTADCYEKEYLTSAEPSEWERDHEILKAYADGQASAERKGKWIDGYHRQVCSVCKYRGFKSWAFCPNCGARMVGDEE